jgi:hypothetical protein
VVVLQYRLSQQSAEVEQVSFAVLQRGAAQTCPSQPPEQQSVSFVHSVPSARQPAAHAPFVQVRPEQQPAGSWQRSPLKPHWHVFPAHSREQHSPELPQLSPPCLQCPAPPPLPDLQAATPTHASAASAINHDSRRPDDARPRGRIVIHGTSARISINLKFPGAGCDVAHILSSELCGCRTCWSQRWSRGASSPRRPTDVATPR